MPLAENYQFKTLEDYGRVVEHYEKCNDHLLLPEMHLVIRVDSHRYGPEWTTHDDGEYPLGEDYAKAYVETAVDLMRGSFRFLFALWHGDEISLLFHPSESCNPRRRSNLHSLIASTAALAFTRHYGRPVVFHSKLSELPTQRHVLDYFLFMRRTFHRNILSQALIRRLEATGLARSAINDRLQPLGGDERIALAAELGFTVDSALPWLRFGVGLWWEESRIGTPQLVDCWNLPEKDESYLAFLVERLSGQTYSFQTELEPVERRQVLAVTPQQQGRLQERRIGQVVPPAQQQRETFRIGSPTKSGSQQHKILPPQNKHKSPKSK